MRKPTEAELKKYCNRLQDNRICFDLIEAEFEVGDSVRLKGGSGPCMNIYSKRTTIVPNGNRSWNGIWVVDYFTQQAVTIDGVSHLQEVAQRSEFHQSQLIIC